jgi:nucleotide-binding universal stress UspA family protein
MATISDHFVRILVPVDFAPASDEDIAAGKAVAVGDHHLEFAPASLRSVELAAALARASAGKLRMVHATPAMQTSSIYTGPISLPTAMIDEIHAKARVTSTQALESLAHSHCAGVPVDFAVRPGPPVQVVLDEAESFDADLVVMAASGRSRVARFFVGSTADRVIRQARVPVLVIPAVHHEG